MGQLLRDLALRLSPAIMSSSGTFVSLRSVSLTGFEPPFRLDVAGLFEFEHIEVAAEDADGRACGVFGDDARHFIENNVLCRDDGFSAYSPEDRSFRMCGLEQPVDEATLNVPLAWLNRIVKICLTHGAVVGILGDELLRDPEHVYIIALPGKPACPPIPVLLVRSISLIPHGFYFGWERSLDEECDVRKYLYQRGEAFFFKELHTIAGRSFACEESTFYHVEYDYEMDDEAMVSAAFYRWPPLGNRDNENGRAAAAENDDWRLRWATANTHHLVGKCSQEGYHNAFKEDQAAVSESASLC